MPEPGRLLQARPRGRGAMGRAGAAGGAAGGSYRSAGSGRPARSRAEDRSDRKRLLPSMRPVPPAPSRAAEPRCAAAAPSTNGRGAPPPRSAAQPRGSPPSLPAPPAPRAPRPAPGPSSRGLRGGRALPDPDGEWGGGRPRARSGTEGAAGTGAAPSRGGSSVPALPRRRSAPPAAAQPRWFHVFFVVIPRSVRHAAMGVEELMRQLGRTIYSSQKGTALPEHFILLFPSPRGRQRFSFQFQN